VAVYRLEVSAEDGALLGVPAGPFDEPRMRAALTGGEREGVVVELASPPRAGQRRVRLEERLHALWQVLVPAQMRAELASTREVIVVADGVLHQLPFETLVFEPDSTAAASRYWLDSGPPVRYAASATILARLSTPDSRPPAGGDGLDLVSAANPVFATAGSTLPPLERLPGTALESAAVRQAFATLASPGRVRILEGEHATEAGVRAALPRARYIHLATHGLVDERQPDILATVALSPRPGATGDDDDGRLQLDEIYNLDLHAEVAVLSMCESRVGKVVPGEGVFALSRAFLAAGAKRVVASLWQAEDESTAEVVSRFLGDSAAADAAHRPSDYTANLQRAKRAARARPEWSDPFFWGPFVLEGAR
jgi:CHAT domain-containing protein